MIIKKEEGKRFERHTLLATQLCRIHRLAQHLHRQPTRFLQATLLLVVLLQQGLRTRIVRANAGRLPAAIVA